MSTATTIRDVFAWQALDSRGTPTVAVEVPLAGGATGEAPVPSAASPRTPQARELGDDDPSCAGQAATRAVAHARNELADTVRGLDAADQAGIDEALRQCDAAA